MNKVPLMKALCGKLRRQTGLSFLELMITTFILALCTGIISDTMALGAKHLKEQTKQSQAIILLNTLCAVVQNDLTYATSYDKNTKVFITTVEDTKAFETQYGIGKWDSSKALRPVGDEQMVWNPASADKKGEIIRRGTVPVPDGSGEPQYYYYTALTPSQDYSNKSMSHVTGSSNNPNDDLQASINIETKEKQFKVHIKIYDGAGKELASTEEGGMLVTPLKDIL